MDPLHYKWRPCRSGWERPALASETMWAQRPKEYHQMFFHACLKLDLQISVSDFHSAAKNAWLLLRYETPDLDVTITRMNASKPYMHANVLKDQDGASRWCQETLFLENKPREAGFKPMKESLLLIKAHHGSRPTALLLYPIDDGSDVVKRFEVMLNAEHQITDGIGIRIVLSKYLSILATVMSTPNGTQGLEVDWTKPLKPPTTPWICCLNSEQVISGPEYESLVRWNHEVLLEKMVGHLHFVTTHL